MQYIDGKPTHDNEWYRSIILSTGFASYMLKQPKVPLQIKEEEEEEGSEGAGSSSLPVVGLFPRVEGTGENAGEISSSPLNAELVGAIKGDEDISEVAAAAQKIVELKKQLDAIEKTITRARRREKEEGSKAKGQEEEDEAMRRREQEQEDAEVSYHLAAAGITTSSNTNTSTATVVNDAGTMRKKAVLSSSDQQAASVHRGEVAGSGAVVMVDTGTMTMATMPNSTTTSSSSSGKLATSTSTTTTARRKNNNVPPVGIVASSSSSVSTKAVPQALPVYSSSSCSPPPPPTLQQKKQYHQPITSQQHRQSSATNTTIAAASSSSFSATSSTPLLASKADTVDDDEDDDLPRTRSHSSSLAHENVQKIGRNETGRGGGAGSNSSDSSGLFSADSSGSSWGVRLATTRKMEPYSSNSRDFNDADDGGQHCYHNTTSDTRDIEHLSLRASSGSHVGLRDDSSGSGRRTVDSGTTTVSSSSSSKPTNVVSPRSNAVLPSTVPAPAATSVVNGLPKRAAVEVQLRDNIFGFSNMRMRTHLIQS